MTLKLSKLLISDKVSPEFENLKKTKHALHPHVITFRGHFRRTLLLSVGCWLQIPHRIRGIRWETAPAPWKTDPSQAPHGARRLVVCGTGRTANLIQKLLNVKN